MRYPAMKTAILTLLAFLPLCLCAQEYDFAKKIGGNTLYFYITSTGGKNGPTVEVTSYTGMTIDLCHRLGAKVIIRGIRTAKDFEYEQTVAAVNRLQDPSIETLLVMADPDHINISSTLEREKLTHNS